MKNFILSLLQSNGTVSAMRVMSLTSLMIAGGLAAWGISHGSDLTGLSLLCGTFLTAGFGGKAVQKGMEAKGAPKP